MLTNERLAEIRGHIWAHLSYTDVVLESPRSTLVEALSLCNEIDRLRTELRDYHRILIGQLPKMQSETIGGDEIFYSDGSAYCIATMQKLISAGLFVQIGSGPNNAIFGKLTDEGRRLMENSK